MESYVASAGLVLNVMADDRRRHPAYGIPGVLCRVALPCGAARLKRRKSPAPRRGCAGLDIAAQTALLRLLRADLETVAGMVNEIEWLRRQVLDLKMVAEEAERVESIASVVDGFDGSLLAVEEQLIQLLLTGTGQDRIRWPTQLAGRITYLAGAVASNDFPPTDQMREVYDRLHERVEGRAAEFAEIVGSGLTGVNSTLDAEGMPGIVRVEGKESGSR